MKEKIITPLVIVAALGYFVDIYDLLLFSIVRTQSLLDLGLQGDAVKNIGLMILDYQMWGMLIGGIFWGVLGDKKGRLSVLFGSILIYSLANIANGFVQDVETYKWLRFIAGIGLAGELGAGITLVSETLSKENRGWGTMIVVSVGVLGAVVAAIVGKEVDWRTAYFIGGGLGLALLLLRIGVYESGMFKSIETEEINRGHFLALFSNRERFGKYLSCIGLGIPIWFVVGILLTFSPEFGKASGATAPLIAGDAIMFGYLGLTFGDFSCGFLSQVLKSRKKAVLFFILGILVTLFPYLFLYGMSPTAYKFLWFCLGTFAGYWGVLVTIASEQFGTNIRATVTTTVPNFVRGALPLFTFSFKYLNNNLGWTLQKSALAVGLVCIVIAFVSTYFLKETYGKDLDYVE